jgi:hypothetical protein
MTVDAATSWLRPRAPTSLRPWNWRPTTRSWWRGHRQPRNQGRFDRRRDAHTCVVPLLVHHHGRGPTEAAAAPLFFSVAYPACPLPATLYNHGRGGVRSGPGEARTILLFHTVSKTSSSKKRCWLLQGDSGPEARREPASFGGGTPLFGGVGHGLKPPRPLQSGGAPSPCLASPGLSSMTS